MSGPVAVTRGSAPLIVSIPHTGIDIPAEIETGLISQWLARKDTDWWIDKLYAFAPDLGATLIRTAISRTVVDVNRDPSGASLYPGQTTTGLCPTETFDGEPLYRAGAEPNDAEIARRASLYFAPYHAALAEEIARLRQCHPHVILYDCHSIRSVVPRLFEGELPHMNIGTNSAASCDPTLSHLIQTVCDASEFSWVVNGRFKGGWITRRYGEPNAGVHAIQMELACRCYLAEPVPDVDDRNWPAPFDEAYAAPMRGVLQSILTACLSFAGRAAAMRTT
jgi:N-formylglutamate deformylase